MIKLELTTLEYMHVITCLRVVSEKVPNRQDELFALSNKIEAQGTPQHNAENVLEAIKQAFPANDNRKQATD